MWGLCFVRDHVTLVHNYVAWSISDVSSWFFWSSLSFSFLCTALLSLLHSVTDLSLQSFYLYTPTFSLPLAFHCIFLFCLSFSLPPSCVLWVTASFFCNNVPLASRHNESKNWSLTKMVFIGSIPGKTHLKSHSKHNVEWSSALIALSFGKLQYVAKCFDCKSIDRDHSLSISNRKVVPFLHWKEAGKRHMLQNKGLKINNNGTWRGHTLSGPMVYSHVPLN